MTSAVGNNTLAIKHGVSLIIKDLEALQGEEDEYSLGEKSGMVNALKSLQLALVQDWDNEKDELKEYGLDIDPEKYL